MISENPVVALARCPVPAITASALAVLLAAVAAVAPRPAVAASPGDTRQLAGRQYERVVGGWVQHDPSGLVFEVDPRVITVKFRAGVARQAERDLHGSLGGVELRRASTGFVDVEIAPEQDLFAAIDAYLGSGAVEIAEPNTFGVYTAVPDDTLYASQWYPPVVEADDAWDTVAGSPDVIVAVLDSGTDFHHEDLGLGTDGYQNVWLNPGEDAWTDPNDPATGNGLDDDGNGFVDDWKGWDFNNGNNDGRGPFSHGTAVAGVTAAKTDNARGIAGIAGGFGAAGTRIMIGGVGDFSPNGAILDDAILYAAENGAHVVQLSLTVGQSAAIDAALQTAYDTFGVVIVCASGNDNSTTVGYPSRDEHVISVGATNSSDLRASFSNHGPDLEVSAPGVNLFTLDLNDGYGATSGTSFSAPLVSGIVALMLDLNPLLTHDEIRQILRDTADKVGGYDYDWNAAMPGHSFELGYGRVNARRAVEEAAGEIFADGFESGDTTAWSSTTP